MQGILDNPDAAYAKLKEMGKGLFGPNGAGLGGLSGLSGLIGGQSAAGGPSGGKPNDPLGGQLGETIGNLLQQGNLLQGMSGLGQGGVRPGQGQVQSRNIAPPGSPAEAAPAVPAAPAPDGAAQQQDNQPMNEVLRQLFNR
jgi:AsmA protein